MTGCRARVSLTLRDREHRPEPRCGDAEAWRREARPLRLYDARHTVASLALAAGKSAKWPAIMRTLARPRAIEAEA